VTQARYDLSGGLAGCGHNQAGCGQRGNRFVGGRLLHQPGGDQCPDRGGGLDPLRFGHCLGRFGSGCHRREQGLGLLGLGPGDDLRCRGRPGQRNYPDRDLRRRPVIAATIIGDVGQVSRFVTRDRFAAYNGTAPVDVSSGKRKLYRLSLRGNRRVNHALMASPIPWSALTRVVSQAFFCVFC